MIKFIKTLKYVIVAVFCITISSCSDYLNREPDDYLTLDMVFGDKARMEGWLGVAYSGIPDPYWGLANHIGYDSMSDDMAPSPRWVQWDFETINQQIGNWNTTSPWPSQFWDKLPKRIRQANIFIQKVKPLPTQGVTEADVENMKYEARFLIAYYYWVLINAYGGVPFYDGILAPDASLQELMVGQIPFDEMIKYINDELLFLSTKLPAVYLEEGEFEQYKHGRATSIMCLAVRARMLLFAASPLVNGNPDYVNHKNIHGKNIFNPVYDSQKWVKAATACRELIEAAHAAGHKLYEEYTNDGKIDPFMSYQNMLFKGYNEGNTEILFARPDSDYERYDKHATPYGAKGNGGLGVTQSLVDAFFMENGLPPILGYTDNDESKPENNPASGYTESGFSDDDEIRNTKWNESKGGGRVTLAGTYNMYCKREPRFYISVLYNRAWYRTENRTTRFMSLEIDGGPSHDAPQNGYLVRKKVHPDHDTRADRFPYRPGILYRLGEAYLNYAEALNESDPGNPDIIKYVNLIRKRAGIPLYGDEAGYIPMPIGYDAVKEAICRERRVELNCEGGIRYNDLRRWKLAEKELNRAFYGMNFGGTKLSDNPNDPKSFFVRKPYQTRIYKKKNYWYPIYQKEVDKDPSLVQSPFWND